jgi:hypothetical protein
MLSAGSQPEYIDWRFQQTFREAFGITTTDYSTFFRKLAKTAKELFGAKLAVVWDNNRSTDCLVLLASVPDIKPIPVADTLRRTGSLTEKAITARRISVADDIVERIGNALLTTHGNVLSEHLTHMVSIPALDAKSNDVAFVLNLFFDDEKVHAFF